jgi:protein phosphatase
MQCPKCGYLNDERTHLCHFCSTPLPRSRRAPTPRYAGQSSRLQTRPLVHIEPLPKASSAFAPLPEGALLNKLRYQVIDVREAGEDLNVYLVEDLWPIHVCPRCKQRIGQPDDLSCPFCGADLSNVTPLSLRHQVRESIEDQAFHAEARLMEMKIDHPGLILPHDFFIEAPYGPPRRYLVEPAFPMGRANSLSTPQRIERVLAWGAQLAQALATLHDHAFFLTDVDLGTISVDGSAARWICLDTVQRVSPTEERTASKLYSSNSRELMELLHHLATGLKHYEPSATLPDPARELFAAALNQQREHLDAASLSNALETTLQELRRPDSLTMQVGYHTDVGQVRVLNEDSLIALNAVAISRSHGMPVGVFCVADGMGGHQAGDVASQAAIQVIAERAAREVLAPIVTGELLPEPSRWLKETIQAANYAVYEKRQRANTDMGTTTVAALVIGTKVTIANVGDSRAYRLNRTGISRITTDHSLVERLVAVGQITRAEAAIHPQRNVIYRTVGDKKEVEVDVYQEPLRLNEAILLCSDGLSGLVSDERMWHMWRNASSPQEACDRLVEAANTAGGEDNITVIVIQFGT